MGPLLVPPAKTKGATAPHAVESSHHHNRARSGIRPRVTIGDEEGIGVTVDEIPISPQSRASAKEKVYDLA